MRVRVGPLPEWMDAHRLLGPGRWEADGEALTALLTPADAADVDARLRGLGFGGRAVAVDITPPLSRSWVREARTADARRRRDTTPGFTRPGVRLDDEGRFSLTPEALALALGREAAALGPVVTVIDAGCGAGGNTIGFARAGCRVLAVERDRARLDLARHNARIYGVDDRVRFFHGDAAEAASLPGDLIFVDPPWGTDWDRAATPSHALPLLDTLVATRGDRRLWAKVPPSFVPPPHAAPEAWFGEAPGDRRRVKFLLLRWPAQAALPTT